MRDDTCGMRKRSTRPNSRVHLRRHVPKNAMPTPGPLEYQSSGRAGRASAAFSLARRLAPPKEVDNVPGPGAYDVGESAIGVAGRS